MLSRTTLILLVLVFVVVGMEYVETPLGKRPSQCVHQVSGDVLVRPTTGGVELVDKKSGEVTGFHPALKECVEDAKLILEKRIALRNNTLTVFMVFSS